MSKLFLKPLINFFVQWSLHAQNAVRIRVPHPIFAMALCSNREYLGGGEFEESAFLNTLPATAFFWGKRWEEEWGEWAEEEVGVSRTWLLPR